MVLHTTSYGSTCQPCRSRQNTVRLWSFFGCSDQGRKSTVLVNKTCSIDGLTRIQFSTAVYLLFCLLLLAVVLLVVVVVVVLFAAAFIFSLSSLGPYIREP